MSESNAMESIRKWLADMSTDMLEERVVEYVVREVHNGRRMVDVLCDPYVKNRLNDQKVAHVLENPEVLAAIEQEIASSFRKRDFGFPG